MTTLAVLIAAPFAVLAVVSIVAAWGPKPTPVQPTRPSSSNRKAGRAR